MNNRAKQLYELLADRKGHYEQATELLFEHLGQNVKNAIMTMCGLDPQTAEDKGYIIWLDLDGIKKSGMLVTVVVAKEGIAPGLIFDQQQIDSIEQSGKMVKISIPNELLELPSTDIVNHIAESKNSGDLIIMQMSSSTTEETNKNKQKLNTKQREFDIDALSDDQRLSLALWNFSNQ